MISFTTREEYLKHYPSTNRTINVTTNIDPITYKVSFTDIQNNYNPKGFKKEEKHISVNDTFLIDSFKSGKSPYIKQTIAINNIFNIIKSGNGNKDLINEARSFGKYTKEYDNIKMNLLPSVRFNFNFDTKAADKNIKAATGLIYLDVDDVDLIDNTNPYIFASWKSLSSTGYGILVKIDGLTLDNFSTNYLELSSILGIKSDIGAKKATQQTILSYDEHIYINNSSLGYKAKGKVSFTDIKANEVQEKEEKHISVNDTFLDYTGTTRFNNINEYFEDDTPYIVFSGAKENMTIPFIPKSIIGNRTNNMFAYLSQIALLNTNSNFNFIKAVANTFNKNCHPKLSEEKVISIVNNVIKKKSTNELLVNKNRQRRIIFNPKIKMDKKEKQKIIAVEVGQVRTEKTKQEIYNIIENWNFTENGKINQNKIAAISGKGIATIKRYWNDFKSYVKELNSDNQKDVVEPEIDMLAAQAFADSFVNKIISRNEEKIKQEIESVNDVDNLFEVLKQSPMKEIHKLSIYDDIKNGTIKTLVQLEERIAA